MKVKELLLESVAKTLYHGTLKEYVPDIMSHGIIPKVGDFVLDMYDEVPPDQLEELVFMADKDGLQTALNAITHHLEKKGIDDTLENIIKYGALVIIRGGGTSYPKMEEEDYGYIDIAAVEPGDYYSHEPVMPDYVLTGKKLLQYLKRYSKHGRYHYGFKYGFVPDEIEQNVLRDELIKRILDYHGKDDMLRNHTIDAVKDMSHKELVKELDKYRRLSPR